MNWIDITNHYIKFTPHILRNTLLFTLCGNISLFFHQSNKMWRREKLKMFYFVYNVIIKCLQHPPQLISNYFTILLLPDYRYLTQRLFPVKIVDIEFSPDVFVLRSPEYKKSIFWNFLCANKCLRLYESYSVENIQLFMSQKLINKETAKLTL